MTISNTVLIATTVCTGLMAGLFYSYSCSVVLGLSKVSDTEYISVMQSINRAIQNPVFFISFFGSLILLPVCAYMQFSRPVSTNFWIILGAAALYIIGSFGVTILGNIPLNNALHKFDLANESKDAIALQRSLFESKWNNLNIVRAISSSLSFILLTIACVYNSSISSAANNS